jgi:hypothetical protein
MRNIERSMLYAFLFMLVASFVDAKENKGVKEPIKEKDTALFHVNFEKKEITANQKDLKEYLHFTFVSVTTDQPIYWPNEEVYLKIVLPASPGREVEVTVQKKDSAPNRLGKLKLNAAGMFVQPVMSGKSKKLEPGEYRVDVKTADGKISAYTTFSVVEGALGALSFGYDFEQVTDPAELEKTNGAWFMGNAEGVGKRWGNGLNIKNELRVLNQPFSGEITVKPRCFLPGCDGVEAGPEEKMTVKDGKIETVLDVGGHSGPFGIEVITKNGNVSYLFGKSGHVERQSIAVSRGLGNDYSATLSPYENTVPVPGREVYIAKDGKRNDPLMISSPVADDEQRIELTVMRDVSSPKIVVRYPLSDDVFATEEVKAASSLKKGEKVYIRCRSPYSFIAVGGFEKEVYFEGWAIAFTESGIDVAVDAPVFALPDKKVDVLIRTADASSGDGVPVFGVLEVFDNRVQSKSAKESLVSALGDSIRGLSSYLTSWRDMTGFFEADFEYEAGESVGGRASAMPKKARVAQAYAPASSKNGGPEATGVGEPVQEQEEVREGEKKVLYCGIVKTGDDGKAVVSVPMPPQTGRVKVRFTAVRTYEYREKSTDIDVKKRSYLEVNVMPMLMPGATVYARTTVVNTGGKNVTLIISGAGVEKKIEESIEPGVREYEFPVTGRVYGKLEMKLVEASGKVLDKRDVELKNMSVYPVTYSDVTVSDGSPLTVRRGEKVAVYANPGMLLQGMVMNVVTSMYSWFGHAEALSSSAAIRVLLLRAIDERIIDGEGLRDTLKSDLVKTVKDLDEVFYDRDRALFRPYPGTETNELWSVWTVRNLRMMLSCLEGSKQLKKEFAGTVENARAMADGAYRELKRRNVDLQGETLYDFEKNVESLPIEIDGKLVYNLLTDPSVVDWFLERMYRGLDADPRKPIDRAFVIDYDRYRFLRSIERSGVFYYLLQNAKALYLQKNPNFQGLFNRIAGGVIQTQEPGVLKGPALLGGVYSSPLTIASFLDLLLLMAKDGSFEKSTVTVDGKKHGLSAGPYVAEAQVKDLAVRADAYTVVRIDRKREINMLDFADNELFFKVKLEKNALRMGDEIDMVIELDDSAMEHGGPAEYYAIVAVPSTLSVKRTEDLLSDYKGQAIYGQREMGSQKIQLLSVPFRGSKRIVLKLGAAQKGVSDGYVLVKHVGDMEIVATVKTGRVSVK